jgi:hypothetical protein
LASEIEADRIQENIFARRKPIQAHEYVAGMKNPPMPQSFNPVGGVIFRGKAGLW